MTPPRRSSSTLLLAVACTVLAACTPTGADEAQVVRIAFFQDLSVPDHVDLVSPSFLAFDLALQRRLAGLRGRCGSRAARHGGRRGRCARHGPRGGADPSYALAVVAPFWHEPGDVARVLADAGVPTISLSPVSASPWLAPAPPPGEPLELWRRFVPDRAAEAALLADIAARRSAEGVAQPVCLVRDGSPYGRGLIEQVAADLGDWPATSIDAADPVAAAGAVREAGCPVVVWGGFAPGARSFARALRDAGAARGRPVDLAGDAMKTIVPPTSPAGDGVVVGSVACSCVDVSIGLRPVEPPVRERVPVRARTRARRVRRGGMGCGAAHGERVRHGGHRSRLDASLDADLHGVRGRRARATRSTISASWSTRGPACSWPPVPVAPGAHVRSSLEPRYTLRA